MKSFVLPDKKEIFCNNPIEAKYIYSEIFLEDNYTCNGIVLNDDSIVVDVGANIGLFSLYVLEKYPRAQVYAFEPGKEIFALLKKNTQRFPERCKLYQAGLSNKEATEDFYYYPNFPAFSTFYTDAEGDKNRMANVALENNSKNLEEVAEELEVSKKLEPLKEKCKLTTLSTIISKEKIERIDLLKMDAQRAELQILEGIETHHWPKIRQISMELHHIGETQTQKLEHLLVSKGFKITKVKDKFFEEKAPVYMLYAVRL